MYDLNASTLRAFLRNKSKAEFSKTMAVAPGGAYVRSTVYDCKASECCAKESGVSRIPHAKKWVE